MPPDIVKEYSLELEYAKKTGITREDITKLRQWLDTQPHLPSEAITELDLILTFHCCNRSAEVTKQLVDLNLTLKTLFTNFFKNRLADQRMLKTMGHYLMLPLETRAYDDSKIFYNRLLDYDVKNFVFHEAVRAALMVIDLWQYMEGTWPSFIIIIDLDRVSLSHLTRLDVHTVQQFLYFLQEALLVKLKGLHFLNAPSFMDRLMLILRPFMKKELMAMLHIHSAGASSLHLHMPLEALPQDFDSASAEMLSKVRAGAEYFESENKKRVVEALRPGKPKTISDIFGGIEGSFKKLDID